MDTRVKFSEVPIGNIFFDEVSGEYWQKINQYGANMITGGDEGYDTFDLNETVIGAAD